MILYIPLQIIGSVFMYHRRPMELSTYMYSMIICTKQSGKRLNIIFVLSIFKHNSIWGFCGNFINLLPPFLLRSTCDRIVKSEMSILRKTRTYQIRPPFFSLYTNILFASSNAFIMFQCIQQLLEKYGTSVFGRAYQPNKEDKDVNYESIWSVRGDVAFATR